MRPWRQRRWEDLVEAGPYTASGIDMVALAWVAGIGTLAAAGLVVAALWWWL